MQHTILNCVFFKDNKHNFIKIEVIELFMNSNVDLELFCITFLKKRVRLTKQYNSFKFNETFRLFYLKKI